MLIAHLSDSHLRPPGILYQGIVDSNAMFAAAVRHLNPLHPAPDLVLFSGDLVDEGTDEAYAAARTALSSIRQPLLAIPGNHDDRGRFRASFPEQVHPSAEGALHLAVGNLGPVRIVGLDVTVPGEHHGDMDDDACAWLQSTLAEQPSRPTIVMMHHPPFESGIAYIDAYRCRRGHRVAEIVGRHPNVELILCGHIHRVMQLRFGGTMLMTAPSTTTAIALRLAPEAEPASFVEPPAMLLHHWKQDRGLVSHLVPIGSFPGPFPFF